MVSKIPFAVVQMRNGYREGGQSGNAVKVQLLFRGELLDSKTLEEGGHKELLGIAFHSSNALIKLP